MLGIRLRPDEEERLERHARSLGRPKSAIARDWIIERLDRISIDALMAAAAARISDYERDRLGSADSVLEALDALDGGYDWGSAGPPV